jgi:uncharacterized protein
VRVEVAYALPDHQWLIALEVGEGATAGDALQQSGLLDDVPVLAGERLTLGIFGRVVAPEQRLRAGDRVEVLRPLSADPKDARRRLAAEGKTMGRRRRA